MGLKAALVGGSIGVASHLFANAIKKVPYSRQPWLHVFMFTFGAWAGNAYSKAERNMVEDINRTRAAQGLPPMTGSAGWYQSA